MKRKKENSKNVCKNTDGTDLRRLPQWRLDIWDTDYNSYNWEPEFRQSFLPDN